MTFSQRAWTLTFFACLVLAALPAAAGAQAVMGTTNGRQVVVFPSPNVGLPNPVRTYVPGLPAVTSPQGVAYYGSDNALVADAGNSRIFVIRISTASLLDTISTAGVYDTAGTIAVAPGLNFALGMGESTTLARIAAPFAAGATITPLTMPGVIRGWQTQAIVFNAAGRAFVYHTTGISVLDPPYSSIAFTMPASPFPGAIAITPDGNTLLITDATTGNVLIFSAPFSAASTPVTLAIAGASQLDGIMASPDGTTVLVVSTGSSGLWAIASPYSASSTVERIGVAATFGAHEDVGISADGQLAILTGERGPDAAFVRAPFTTAGRTVFAVAIAGGRGAGSVRFLPPGLAPGLTISKSGPSTAPTGSNITYTITYGNTGGNNAANVVIRDPVPAGTTFVSATAGGTFLAGSVTWNIGTVNAGVTGQTVSFTVNVTAASGSVDNVNYTIEGTGIAPIPGPPVFTQISGVAPTATPTVAPSLTPTVIAGAPVNVPTLSFPMLALLALGLAIAAVLLIGRKL